MNYEKRTGEWTDKFFKHLDEHHSELVMYFYTKVFFSPAVDNPNVLYAAYSPLEDSTEQKDIREKMFHVFENYYREHPVL